MEHIENRYFYTFLSTKERKLYTLLFDGLISGKTSFLFNTLGVDIGKVLDALSDDCPELYFVNDFSVSYTPWEIHFSAKEPFCYSESERRDIKKKLDELVESFFDCDDDFKKELAIHNYIVGNVIYDEDYKKRTGKEERNNHCLVGPVLHGRGVCSGISRLAQYLMIKLGIPVIYYTGTCWSAVDPTPGGHAWLAVKIQGRYYHLDISHDVCHSKDSHVPQYSYFNVSDDDIRLDHSFDEKRYENVKCDSYMYNYYQKYKRFYTNRVQIRDAVLKHFSSAPIEGNTKRFSFKVARHISDDDMEAILNEVLYATDTVSYAYSYGLQNVYSVEFTY